MKKTAAAGMSLLFFMPDTIGQNTKKDYIRIEHEAGGATHLAMSECDSDAIDKVADARANNGTNVERVPARR